MSAREDACARHQRQRWLRPDAHRWLRSDVARFLVPGAAASVYSDVERKYSPNQPRVPAGSGRESGRWTDGNSGGAASPTGMIDFGSLPNFSDLFSLFQIAPTETDNSDYTQLAGDVPEGNESGTSQTHVVPEIPKERPDSSSDRMKVVRDIARLNSQVMRVMSVLDVVSIATEHAGWLKSYDGAMRSYGDPPRSLEELQGRVSSVSESGYEDHHIEERTLLRRLGFTWGEINDPNNIVRIPVLKHYDISGWYSKPNLDFGGLTPRDYLRDKGAAERRQVGLDALIRFGVLKP